MLAQKNNPISALFTAIRPHRIRTMREFAEQEIILPPGGPRAGLRFRCDFAPWTGLILDEFTAGRFRYFWLSGPIQDGKTTIALIIPMMYFLFEMRENIILGAPTMEIGQGKYEEEIKPIIMHSSFSKFVPETGRGSRGGASEAIIFGNGARIRFMASGGKDWQRSVFPARIVFLTEVDKMDVPGKASRETDPVSQIIARTGSFAREDTMLVFAECTMSKISGRINQEITIKGTNSSVALPCPHCGAYVIPDREHFKGWQEARNVIEARERSAYFCNECNKPWTEMERLAALQKPILLHEGQKIDKARIITGSIPLTRTFGFRWNAMHSALKSTAFIGEKEFEAQRSGSSNSQKELMQFTWAQPYEEEAEDLSGVDIGIIQSKISKIPRGKIPNDIKFLTVAIDIGLWTCWWTAWAWTLDAQGYCIDYGEIVVPQPDRRSPDPRMILQALKAFRNETLDIGWQKFGGAKILADLVIVDSGYKSEITFAFTQESGAKFFAIKGLGSKRDQEKWRAPRALSGRQIGNNWYISRQAKNIRLLNINVDEWKREVHEGFRMSAGSAGSLCIYFADRTHHIQFAKQITSERRVEEYTPGKGTQIYWVQDRKANHWLDCTAMCRCAADILGARSIAVPLVKKPMVVDRYLARDRKEKSEFRIGR